MSLDNRPSSRLGLKKEDYSTSSLESLAQFTKALYPRPCIVVCSVNVYKAIHALCEVQILIKAPIQRLY